MPNDRTQDARDHDDSDLIDNAEAAPAEGGSAGGNLARDIATQDELASVADPDGRTAVEKSDAIQNDTATRSNRQRDG